MLLLTSYGCHSLGGLHLLSKRHLFDESRERSEDSCVLLFLVHQSQVARETSFLATNR